MTAWKLAVAGLVVVVAALLFTINRLKKQVVEPAPAEVAQVSAPAAPPAPAVTPAAPEPAKPSPVASRRPAPKPVREPKPATPPQVTSPASPPPSVEKHAEPSPAPTPVPTPAPVPVPTPAPAPEPRRVTIPSGAVLVVRTQNTLSTERNLIGDTFSVSLAEPLVVDGLVVAEKGAELEGRVVRSDKGGRVEGVASLSVELVRLNTSDGQKLSIATDLHEVRAERKRGSDAKKVGVATGVGAIIGAIAGGGKGAAIGAGVGAGAGAGTVAATRGDPATIASESTLRFHLRAPIEVTEKK